MAASPTHIDKAQYVALRKLLMEKYPEEFAVAFSSSQENFRDWLNTKTELSVDHKANMKTAVASWVEALKAEK
jgi:hypothetical protein